MPVEIIAGKIFLIRGQKVVLSFHLAELYGVQTRVLVQAVKRNIERFPEDFIFQLKVSEADTLVSQNVIPHKKYLGGYMPYAFTQEGVAMLSSVLRSKRAVQINISIMRAFVRIREYLATHKDVLKKLEEHDRQIKTIFGVINKMLLPPKPKKKGKVGF
ncbi:MAG: ORF6N domain-containing protein [bacterium]